MASNQAKRPTNNKKPTSDGKKTTAKKAKDTKTKAAEPAKAPRKEKKTGPYQANLLARGIGAAVCIFLAVMLALGMFGAHAVVVDFFCGLFQGLIGYGWWAVPVALVAAALLLLLCRDRSQALRLWCLGLVPLFLGSLLHLLLCPYPYEMGLKTFAALWRDGQSLFAGGVLGGFLSVSFETWFSPIGAGILFVLVLAALLAGIFRVTPASLFRGWRSRRAERKLRRAQEEFDDDDPFYDDPYYDDYGDDLPPVREMPRQEEPLRSSVRMERPPERRESVPFWSRFTDRKKKALDIPLHEEEPPKAQAARPATREEKAAGVLKGTKESFFDRKSAVKRPDQVLEELKDSEDVIDFDDDVPPVPVDMPAPSFQGEQDLPDPVVEVPKEPTRGQKREAIRKEAAVVTQTIERTLEEAPKAYQYPPLAVLTEPSGDGKQAADREVGDTLDRLSSVLTSFGIDGHVTGAVQGPSVTRYEIALEQGVRLNKLTNLSDDVALALGVSNVRIAPVPGKISVVGIEVPNKTVTPVPIREVLSSEAFRKHKSSAAFSVGKDIGGNYIVGDCAKLPHMLIAGTTGSGKSVCINSLIVSMLYKSTPEELRLIMVDPKMVELGGYNGIPHLLIPVVTDPKKAAGALQWAVVEMMKRYRLFAEAGVRELSGYNQWAKTQENVEPMPKVVIVIDELADLMLVAAKEVEESICRVAQMGRASGMHLVIATQRPSADVITGLMKANIPSRVAFAVASSLESRIILDTTGAEKLVGKGDMLWFPLGAAKPLRVQGCFISDEEVAAVVDCVKENATAEYDEDVLEQIEQHVSESEKKGKGSSGGGFPAGEEGEPQDELFPAAVDVILELGQASVSMLQRRLKLGYARAARLVDQMEQQGIVGPFEGSKPRQLLITKEQWEAMKSGVPAPGEEDLNPPVEEELLPFEAVPQPYE